MSTSRLAIAAVIAPLLLAGCGDSPETPKTTAPPAASAPSPADAALIANHELMAREIIANVKSLGKAFERVWDEESAKAAVPTIDSLLVNFETLQQKSAALPKMTDAQRSKMDPSLDQDVNMATAKMLIEVKRIKAIPKLRAVLHDSLMKFNPAPE